MSTQLNNPVTTPPPSTLNVNVPTTNGAAPATELPPRISRAERKAATRARILKAAREVFFRDGFMDTSLDEVASRASIGKGTLYRHFESKAELYVAVLMEKGDYFEHKMLEAIDPAAGPVEQISQLGRFYRDFWTEHPHHFRIFWAISNQETIGDLPAALLQQVKELWERPLHHLEKIIQAGIDRGEIRDCDAWVMANVLWGIGNSGFEAATMPEKARLVQCESEQMYKTGLDLVLYGLTQ